MCKSSALIHDEMEDRPNPEDERIEAWEYWHERANKFESENSRLLIENKELHLDLALSRTTLSHGWEALSTAPTEAYEYFFVRPVGFHPATGKRYLPSVVHRINGRLYAPDNEIEPLYFGEDEPDNHPLYQMLEWRPIPVKWMAIEPSAVTAGDRE